MVFASLVRVSDAALHHGAGVTHMSRFRTRPTRGLRPCSGCSTRTMTASSTRRSLWPAVSGMRDSGTSSIAGTETGKSEHLAKLDLTGFLCKITRGVDQIVELEEKGLQEV